MPLRRVPCQAAEVLTLLSVAALVIVISGACAARKPALPVPDPREGKTSYRTIPPSGGDVAGSVELGETITAAHASNDNKPPEYPGYALKAGCGEGTVPVRVHIGADGNVAHQRDIPDRPLPDDPCHVAFRAAVQSAIASWKFSPAFRQRKVPHDDGGPGRLPRWEQTPVEIYVDFEFLFRVEQGKGVVLSK
jgi:hypothetical protein